MSLCIPVLNYQNKYVLIDGIFYKGLQNYPLYYMFYHGSYDVPPIDNEKHLSSLYHIYYNTSPPILVWT